MLSVKNLTKIFPTKRSLFKRQQKDFIAVDNISFTINEGEIVGILGPNGAGKTTTLHMLVDALTPTHGSIHYFGKDLHKHRTDILQHVAFASAYTNLPPRLTVYENLEVFGRLYNIPYSTLKQRIQQYLELFGLANKMYDAVETLSAGQQTRVMLAKAFIVHPKIMILDEPTSSLDPDIALEIRTLIIKLQKEYGLTVILASHNMDEVATICNRVIVLLKGTILADNTPEFLAKAITSTTVHLVIVDGLKRIAAYAQQKNLPYNLQERVIEITVNESRIAELLADLAKLDIRYSNIIIRQPTLEHYFLHVARLSRQGASV